MRFVIAGLGGIGGVLAARLHLAGHQVIGLARGPHLSAVREHGLRLETPTESLIAHIEVRSHPTEVSFGAEDVVVLAVKSQDTWNVVRALTEIAPSGTPVLCAQNGVVNEPCALRFFPDVYGGVVICPTAFLQPGVVRAYSTPITGLLDVGRYPAGQDDVSRGLAAVLNSATYDARSIPDVRRWKFAKLLTNLGNAVEAVCGPQARPGPLTDLLQAEGEAVLRAADIDHASGAEDKARRRNLLDLQPIAGERRPGGSTWQSLARQTGVTEIDYLCGEIVLLGRLHGVPTPANTRLQQLGAHLASTHAPPGAISADAVMAEIGNT
jgi:2-dehydropantoate 2-reductase